MVRVTSMIQAALMSLAALVSLGGCGSSTGSAILLAGTTSTYDSGLLDRLTHAFEQAYPNYRLKVVAVGSGEALELGRRKDVDVLLVHSPGAEASFLEGGFGFERVPVMSNDFVLVGPGDDPAGAREAASAPEALARIARSESRFVSRGDSSGTHQRELELWRAAGIVPAGPWYRETGQGQGETLQIADERRAYMLVDEATYLTMKDIVSLRVVFRGDPHLLNLYSVIRVVGAAHPEGARVFTRWLTSVRGRSVIADFGRDRFGRSLFTPFDAGAGTAKPAGRDTGP